MKKYVVFATIKDEQNNITGYRLFCVETMKVNDIPREKAKEGVHLICDVTWDDNLKGLVSTNESSISKLPTLDAGTRRLRGYGGIFLYEIVTDESDNIIGAVLYDTNGARGAVTYDSMLQLLENHTENIRIYTLNFDLTQDVRGKRVISEHTGEFKARRRKLDAYKSTSFRVTDAQERKDSCGVVSKDENPDIVPVVPVYSLSEAASSMFNSRAGNKLLTSSASLKMLVPYYYVLLSTLKKRPATDEAIKTMGVTEDTFYYNSAFVSTMTDGELVFILMHEVMHVAMCHAARHGKRNHELWNIATDLYINEMLVHDFDLIPGKEKVIQVDNPRGGTQRIPVCAPVWGYYFSSIGEVCNLSKDIPELIYKRLAQENPPKNSKSSEGGGGNGGGSSSENNDGGDSGDGNKDPFKSDSEDTGGETKTVSYNGKELKGACLDDIKSNVGHDTEDNKQKSEEMSLQKLQDMITKKKMVEDKMGSSLTKGMSGCELLQRIIEYNSGGTTDWRKLLRNICKGRPRKKYTLASPDETYMNLGMTLAGRRRIGKPDKLKGIVFAIDASGSVDDKLLSYLITEVESIYKQYDVEGILMYWNTKVCSSGRFSKRGDMRKVDSNFTGGTDVKCVFDFISGKSKVDGKKFELRGRDIQALFIVSDGLFNNNYDEYESVYGNKTMWLIDGNPYGFNPSFGKVSILSKHDD